MKDTAEVLAGCVIGLIILAVAVAFGTTVLWLAWNFVAPVFWSAAPHLTWLQALGASILLNLLFGSRAVVMRKD